MSSEQQYVLGTHDEEVSRLGMQHRVWRPRAFSVWRRAGFAAGHTLLDIGCGPGYATLDLAEIVGSTGRVVAYDQSRKFLDALMARAERRGFRNIDTHQVDLDIDDLPVVTADGAWLRWILTFVKRPRALLAQVAAAIKPGGVIALHEYFDYSTWRIPECRELDEFVSAAITSWRATGGEPNIGMAAPRWLHELGFTTTITRPVVDIVRPGDSMWRWLRGYVDVGRARLVDIGYLTCGRADAIWEAFVAAEQDNDTLMVTPGVVEVIAVRRLSSTT